jgi:hypothetical protein
VRSMAERVGSITRPTIPPAAREFLEEQPMIVVGSGAADDRVWASLREDVEDLQEPVEEFDLFDQCMFTIGVTRHGRRSEDFGYVYGKGGRERRPALAMDMRGFDPPQYDFLAFPGEESPQIECNEDAGGQDTDE